MSEVSKGPLGSGITINPSQDQFYDIIGLQRLKDSYMREGETSPQERLAYVSDMFSSNPEHAQRLYNYSSNFWFGYSTPILSFGRNSHGLPISCFLNFVHDSKSGLVNNLSETNWLSMVGGGVGVYWDVRGQDEKSVGVIPHMKVYDDSVLAYKQGTTRRGSYAMYLDIDHPDIIEFLEMRKETGDPRRKCLNLHYGVNIPDSFMEIIEASMLDASINDDWELKDPETRKVHDVVSARDLWEKILDLRAGQGRGEPYVHYIDSSNRSIPKHLKDQGYRVRQSNLCLTGDTIIEISLTINQIVKPMSIRLDHFSEKFTLGLYNNVWVKSYDIITNEESWAEVSNAGQTGIVEELIEIETELGNIIKCTTDHPILTKDRGWVKAGDLLETDNLVEF